MTLHQLQTASERNTSRLAPTTFQIVFRSCVWPSPKFGFADGYSEIRATISVWASRPESSGMGAPERIESSCKEIQLLYTFQKQGPASLVPPMHL